MEFTHSRNHLRRAIKALAGRPPIPANAKLFVFNETLERYVRAPRLVDTCRTLHRLKLGALAVRLRGRDLTLVGSLS